MEEASGSSGGRAYSRRGTARTSERTSERANERAKVQPWSRGQRSSAVHCLGGKRGRGKVLREVEPVQQGQRAKGRR